MKKQFLKIAGVSSEAAFYKKYPTEEAFFAAHPEAKKMAMGGTPEAYPQIATFDNAFSYGVKPGPQYLAHGGSAYPQAQSEAQFFVPIYTDVYNPYNKAMGGSNVEMYPNAKTTPHWGPTNVWFQEGGQEGMQEGQNLDRAGALNRTGSFVNNLKTTAAKANAKNAMMSAVSNVGMAKYGKQLSKYDPGGPTAVNSASTSNNQVNALTPEELALAQQFKINDPGFDPAGTRLKIKQLQRESWIDEQMQRKAQNYPLYGPGPQGPGGYPGSYTVNGYNVIPFITAENAQQYPGGYPVYPHSNYGPQGDMRQFLNDYFVYTNNRPYAGSTTKGRVSVDGQRAGKFYGNMPLIKAMFPELYGKGNFADLMANNADFRNRADAMGLTSYKEPTGLKRLFGSREYTFNQRVPWEAPTVTLKPKSGPGMLEDKPEYRQKPEVKNWPDEINPIPELMPKQPASTNTTIPYAISPPASSTSSKGYLSPEGYAAINKFENTIGTYQTEDKYGNPLKPSDPDYGKAISMEKGDNYAQTGDKDKIESYINSTIGKDTWDKLPENVKTQAYSFMFNTGKYDAALNGLAQAINNSTGGGDLGNERRGYTKDQSIASIKGADLSNPDLYNNYVNVLGDQYNSIADNTAVYQSGPGAVYAPTLKRRAISIDDIMNQPGMNSKSTSTTKSQAPSNSNSMDPNVAKKKAAMMNPNVNQAYINAQIAATPQTPFDPNKVTPPTYGANSIVAAPGMSDQRYEPYTTFPFAPSGSDYSNILDDGRPWNQGYSTMGVYGETPNAASYISSPPYRTPVGPVVGPDGYAYGGNTSYKYGGSYRQGDVVYMSDDEIAEFIRNGGQIEEME
jgi:GH24 family phage-related lysozyme (muramidase)